MGDEHPKRVLDAVSEGYRVREHHSKMDTPRNVAGNLDVETRGPDALEYEESEDSEDDALPYDESDEMSLVALSWILAIHLFAVAVTVPVLPSLLLDIMQGAFAISVLGR